jgi:hypothetical protein
MNWQVLVQSVLINAGVSLFLLQKSMRPVISGEEIQLVWNKVGRWPMLLLTRLLATGWSVPLVCHILLAARCLLPLLTAYYPPLSQIDREEAGYLNAAGVGDVLRQLGVVVREQPGPSYSKFFDHAN